MPNYRKLWVDWNEKRLVTSDIVPSTVRLADFLKYESVPFQVAIIELDIDPATRRFSRLDVSNMSMRMVINDTFDAASPLVEQTTWSKNTSENILTGELDLNTSGMNSYIGSADNKTAYFEIQITDGTVRSKVFRAEINLKQAVAQVATTSPDPQQEYYTKSEMNGLFPRFRMEPGEQFTIVSPDGSYERTLGVSNDGEAIDIIAPT